MPKPRTIAREQRRLGRQVAVADGLAALAELADNPPPALPEPARQGYRAQLTHMRETLSRTRLHTHKPPLALGDTPGAESE